MSAGTFGPSITHGTGLAATSVASTETRGGQTIIKLRSGANGVGDNQRLQAIADVFAKGTVTATTINS